MNESTYGFSQEQLTDDLFEVKIDEEDIKPLPETRKNKMIKILAASSSIVFSSLGGYLESTVMPHLLPGAFTSNFLYQPMIALTIPIASRSIYKFMNHVGNKVFHGSSKFKESYTLPISVISFESFDKVAEAVNRTRGLVPKYLSEPNKTIYQKSSIGQAIFSQAKIGNLALPLSTADLIAIAVLTAYFAIKTLPIKKLKEFEHRAYEIGRFLFETKKKDYKSYAVLGSTLAAIGSTLALASGMLLHTVVPSACYGAVKGGDYITNKLRARNRKV